MGYIRAICISEKKGTPKTQVNEAVLVENFGLKGDAHAGNWHRQVSILPVEAVERFVETMRLTDCDPVVMEDGTYSSPEGSEKGEETSMFLPGCFGENLLVEGLELKNLPCGTRLMVGNAVLELTQRGKECHSGCEIRKRTGDCIMPGEGIFAQVIKGGNIRTGDEIEICAPESDRPFRAAVITASDRGFAGEYEDASGPLLAQKLKDMGFEVIETVLLPDDKEQIKLNLIRLCDRRDADLIVTTGGTGLSIRDVTPEATQEAATKNAPGFAEAIRAASLKITPHAMLSRGVSVIRNRTLIINLPGSPKAVEESMDVIAKALPHGLAILTGRGDN